MHIDALDSYVHGHSLIHRLDPRIKLSLTVLLIITAALTPDHSWITFGLLELLLLLIVLLSQVGFGLVSRRAAVALPFTLAALTVILTTPGESLVDFTLFGGSWSITDMGLLRFLFIVLRSFLSVQAAVILATTTTFPDLLWSMRALRVPRVMVAIGSFLYRYIFVLADEVQRLMRAREARSVAPVSAHRPRRVGRSLAWRAGVTGALAGTLFIRSYERSERIYTAMLARGYDGEVRTLSPPILRPIDLGIGIAGAMILVALMFLSRMA